MMKTPQQDHEGSRDVLYPYGAPSDLIQDYYRYDNFEVRDPCRSCQ